VAKVHTAHQANGPVAVKLVGDVLWRCGERLEVICGDGAYGGVFTYGLIWLPEFMILLRNCPTSIGFDYVAVLWLTGWGWLLLLHGLGYGRNVAPERWQTVVFAAYIGGLLAIMFGLPVGVWLAIG
jgi:hypothetical protein